jgi:nucleoside-diphosphate-sugar epimerase
LAPAADVVVDSIAFDAEDVARYDADNVGRLIVVSSASVYCDARGRTLDEAARNGFPEFDGPVTEDQPTVAPGPETYSTRKVGMEIAARNRFGEQATILRPCAVYGAWSRHPREWWFVKRLLDGRRRIPLAFDGKSQFHTTSANMMAGFCIAAAEQDLGGTFNIADDFAADVALLGWHIAEELDLECEFLPFDGPPQGSVGRTPWSVPKPFEVSCKAACDAGWDGFTTYPGVGNSAIAWLRDFNPHVWRSAFPQLAAYPWDLFDYAAEEAWLDG